MRCCTTIYHKHHIYINCNAYFITFSQPLQQHISNFIFFCNLSSILFLPTSTLTGIKYWSVMYFIVTSHQSLCIIFRKVTDSIGSISLHILTPTLNAYYGSPSYCSCISLHILMLALEQCCQDFLMQQFKNSRPTCSIILNIFFYHFTILLSGKHHFHFTEFLLKPAQFLTYDPIRPEVTHHD